jgi:UDP:flavonoid glycosyltransferase YjiC (YdhE family)
MHVGIASAAYWGDVMPFVPIAEELRRRGHRVTMVVPEGFHDMLGRYDVELVHLGTDFSPRELAAHGDIIEQSSSIRGMQAALDLWIRQLSIEPAHAIVEVLHAVDPDVWLCHNTMAWLVELHARPTGTPLVVGHLFPMMIPTATRMPPMLPGPANLPAPVCRAAWQLGRRMTARMGFDHEVNALRAEYGLDPAFASTGFGWERADRVLALTSPTYWPVPDDWPDRVVATGLTVWGHIDDPLPDGLRDHLQAGDPPVLVTLGTSAASNARDAFELAADAARSLGRRTVLLVGNQRNVQQLTHRDDVWQFASLPAVLPYVRTVVHAAGHGTTAAALHAGVPQVVLPQTFDQIEHARRLEELDVGVSVPWRQRSIQRIAAALDRTDHDTVRAAATTIAATLAHENGPVSAADHVEACAT